MKRTGWFRKSGLRVGILLGCAVAWVLVQPIFATAAGDPSAELRTAMTHAGFAAKYEALKEVTMHLHHTLNCLVGPQDKLFDVSAGNPCQGQGNGYLPDLKAAKGETAAYYDAWWAAQIAGQAVTSNNLDAAKAAARIVDRVLADAVKVM
jgi:hypothetical protein